MLKQNSLDSFHFKFLYWVSGDVAVRGPLFVSGKRSAFSDEVQPTRVVIHHLQVPISSPCAQKLRETTRFKVMGLGFMPKALRDEPKSKWYNLLESVADPGTEL